jgi:hypothetical protein
MFENFLLFLLVIVKVVLSCFVLPAIVGVLIYGTGSLIRSTLDEIKLEKSEKFRASNEIKTGE